MTVSDAVLAEATALLRDCDGPRTTPSGAAGLAGVLATAGSPSSARDSAVDSESRILVIITETELDKDEPS